MNQYRIKNPIVAGLIVIATYIFGVVVATVVIIGPALVQSWIS